MKKHIFKDTETLDGLLVDWFGRDSSAITVTKEARLGWEKGLGEDSAFSDFFLPKDADMLTKYKEINRIGSEYLNIMGTNKKVTFGEGSGGWTDGKHIHVGTAVFADESLTFPAALDIFTGLVVHEGLHSLYTDFGKNSYPNKFVKHLCNIIEDERIEVEGGKVFPGFMNFISRTKRYFFKPYSVEGLSVMQRFLNVLGGCIRYSFSVKKDEAEFFGYYLLKCKELLLNSKLKSTKDSYELALKIFEIAKDIYEDEKKEREEKEKESKEDSEKKEKKDKTDNTEDEPSEEESNTEEDATENTGNGKNEEGEETKEGNKGSEEAEENENSNTENTEEADTSLDVDNMDADLNNITADENNEAKKDSNLTEAVRQFAEGLCEKGSMKDTIIENAKEPSSYRGDVYAMTKSSVSSYVPSIRKALSALIDEKEAKLYGMRNGKLDPSKLVEARQGVPNVYTQQHINETHGATIVLVVDESGSMYWNDKCVKARETAILINESLKGLKGIDLYIYGHTADLGKAVGCNDATNIIAYKEGAKDKRNEKALGGITARSNNRDGVALMEIAHRVRKHTDKQALMLVISDGEPEAHGYYGAKALQDTKDKIALISKNNFEVVGVTIDNYTSNIYPEELHISNVSELPTKLSKYIKKYIIKNL